MAPAGKWLLVNDVTEYQKLSNDTDIPVCKLHEAVMGIKTFHLSVMSRDIMVA